MLSLSLKRLSSAQLTAPLTKKISSEHFFCPTFWTANDWRRRKSEPRKFKPSAPYVGVLQLTTHESASNAPHRWGYHRWDMESTSFRRQYRSVDNPYILRRTINLTNKGAMDTGRGDIENRWLGWLPAESPAQS